MSSPYSDLRVWRHAMNLAIAIYRATDSFPKHELYGLGQQMRRAAVSVASNIAEGKGRNSDREFRQFLFHARGSLLELETQIFIASRLGYISETAMAESQAQSKEVGKSLAGLLNALANVAA